jgi:hypothetical protein
MQIENTEYYRNSLSNFGDEKRRFTDRDELYKSRAKEV